MQTDLIYTYRFFFNRRDGTADEVDFCACACEGAEKLFIEWCINDIGFDETPDAHVEVVFDQYDAILYGKRYGLVENGSNNYFDKRCKNDTKASKSRSSITNEIL